MTRLRTLGRRGGFPICADCARREHLLIGDCRAANVRCYWCGQREPSTTNEVEDQTINGKIMMLIGIGLTSRAVAERLNITSSAAVRKRLERMRQSQLRV